MGVTVKNLTNKEENLSIITEFKVKFYHLQEEPSMTSPKLTIPGIYASL